MIDEAEAQLSRAKQHIEELAELIAKEPPFIYVVEINDRTGECATFAEGKDHVIWKVKDQSFDVTQKLRAALDYAYWEKVSPFAEKAGQKTNIQFPFSESGAKLSEAVSNRLAKKVSIEFYNAIMALRPHGGSDGNRLLYALHKLSAEGRHRFPLPIAEFKKVDTQTLKTLIPEFPPNFFGQDIGFSGAHRDIVWQIPALPFLPEYSVRKHKIDIQVKVSIQLPEETGKEEMIHLYREMAIESEQAIKTIRSH